MSTNGNIVKVIVSSVEDWPASTDVWHGEASAFADIQSWMTSNKLLLNQSKTEFLLFGMSSQLDKIQSLNSLDLSDSTVLCGSTVWNLGVIFDLTFSFDDHVRSVCRSSQYHIWDIRRIRQILPRSAL